MVYLIYGSEEDINGTRNVVCNQHRTRNVCHKHLNISRLPVRAMPILITNYKKLV